MPRGDRTGPDGYGPRTGRGLGFCNGYGNPGYMTPGGRGMGLGRGYGRGYGYGRGMGWRSAWQGRAVNPSYYGAPVPRMSVEDEKAELKAYMKGLSSELEALQKRLEELEKEE